MPIRFTRFTKAEVEYLVGEEKFIKDIPPRGLDGNYQVIVAPVYRKGQTQPVKALVVLARVATPIPGLPGAMPSVALTWHGHRIRGIDRETRHDNPDGSSVAGWHEHLWSAEYLDSLVRACPEPKHKDMLGILKDGLKHWNIRIAKEQMELE
jgi:hypothetical protein